MNQLTPLHSRRKFLKQSAAALTVPWIAPQTRVSLPDGITGIGNLKNMNAHHLPIATLARAFHGVPSDATWTQEGGFTK